MASAVIEFLVGVGEPQLVRPEIPTPREFKYLSNIDDQASLRHHLPFVHFYPPNKEIDDVDPVEVIKMGLSKALVHYYPLAGRLRNAEKGKLVVDCCGDGVVFREADAFITLEKLQKMNGGLKPPFAQWERLLEDDVWGNDAILGSPLLRMQVTRLACGGFVLAYTLNHCVCDTIGALQFIKAISEFCQDPHRTTPSTPPSWARESLKPRSPLTISFPHHEYTKTKHQYSTKMDSKHLTQTSVFLSNSDILALKCQVNNGKCLTFDVVASCLWRARTRTLLIKPDDQQVMRLFFPIDTRFQDKPELPKGFYGSTMVVPCVVTKASELIDKPLHFAVSLISRVKSDFSGDGYRASVLDFLEVNREAEFCKEGAYFATDMRWFKFAEVDFGWGSGVYGGPARAGVGPEPGIVTSVFHHKNLNGVDGLLALVSLPPSLAIKFHEEVRREIGGFSKL